jgi:hypothetical protein
VACLLLSACFGTPANRAVTGEEPTTAASGRPLIVRRSAADDRVTAYVWQQQGQFVRIETAESGAGAHRHPVTITGKQMTQTLRRARFARADAKPILTDEAIDKIAAPLAEALSRSAPEQEVTFAVTYRPPGLGLLMSRRVTTGRLFRENEGLHLIIGLLQAPYEEEMLATGQRIAFTPGSRHQRIQEGWSLGTDNLVTHPEAGRDDWILISPAAGTESPKTETAASPTPQHKSLPEPQPATRPNNYTRVEERLEALKKLRDKGLISEKVYEQKSRQILEEL